MKEKPIVTVVYICICLLSFLLPLHAQPKDDEKAATLMAEAAEIAKRFGGTLKPHLKEALQTAGPVDAIEVCAFQAPKIAADLSRETGWSVKRVSLKPRNRQAAFPDAWEEGVLRLFNERLAKGESSETIAYAEIIDGRFRFMKTQGVDAPCLTCHGENLSPAVEKALRERYPDDQATGYALGEIRGAFSLSKKL